MTDTYKILGQAELAGAPSTTTLYTVPSEMEAIIRHISVVNTTAGAASAKLWIGGSADVNVILPAVVMGAAEFAQWDGTMTLEAAQTLVGYASAASSISVTVHGDEVS